MLKKFCCLKVFCFTINRFAVTLAGAEAKSSEKKRSFFKNFYSHKNFTPASPFLFYNFDILSK